MLLEGSHVALDVGHKVALAQSGGFQVVGSNQVVDGDGTTTSLVGVVSLDVVIVVLNDVLAKSKVSYFILDWGCVYLSALTLVLTS